MCTVYELEARFAVADGEERWRRGSIGQFITNWRSYDASTLTKLRLYARNNWIKIRTRSSCCGNHGEPGC